MGSDRRRRSRSRSRRRARPASSPSPSPPRRASGKDRHRSPERRSSKAAEVKGKKKAVAAAAASEEDSDSGAASAAESASEGEAQQQQSLAARCALLEVENAALKTENGELKKRLVAALQSPKARAAAVAAKPGQPPARQPSPAKPPPAAAPPADSRRARLAAAEAEPPSSRRREAASTTGGARRGRSPSPAKDEDDDPMKQNAVLLCNSVMEAYNTQIPNNIPGEKRLPMVKDKLGRFMDSFDNSIQILDLKSGGAIIRDRKMFTMRYSCVFRESGTKLKGTVHKRFYFDARGKTPTYCLDFETHESLVTATPGTPQDGKLGVRDPRTENLIVLYEEKGGRITRMWLKPDIEKLGLDPTAGEDVLTRTDVFKTFEAKIKELRGGTLGEVIFNNYHDMPSIG